MENYEVKIQHKVLERCLEVGWGSCGSCFISLGVLTFDCDTGTIANTVAKKNYYPPNWKCSFYQKQSID